MSLRINPAPDLLFQRKLEAAKLHALNTCIVGASNKIADILQTHAWALTQPLHYNRPGRYVRATENPVTALDIVNFAWDPDTQSLSPRITQWIYCADRISSDVRKMLFEPRNRTASPYTDVAFGLTDNQRHVLFGAMTASTSRHGNCGDRSTLIAKYLWEHHDGMVHRIEGIFMRTFNHMLVVVNRSGELTQPDTWGDAWIVDAWYQDQGIIFHAREFQRIIQDIKKFAEEQREQAKTLFGFRNDASYPDDHQHIDGCLWEIKPKVDRYPSYSSAMKFEDYYYVDDGRFGDGQKHYLSAPSAHTSKLKRCLKTIKKLSTVENRNAFFQQKKKVTAVPASTPAPDTHTAAGTLSFSM